MGIRKHFLWLLPRDPQDAAEEIELQHEYANPNEALRDIERGMDLREPVSFQKEILDDLYRDAADASRYDTVPSHEIPAAMIALKGAPTNNIGAYLAWKAKQDG